MAAKAVTFGEALKPEFKEYIKQVISNAKILANILVQRGFKIVTGGTDSHIVWLDLSPKNLTGDKAEKILEDVGIACNKNAIPYDPNPPKITSGLRFGTPAATSRGFDNNDFEKVANMIADVLDSLLLEDKDRLTICNKIKNQVLEICSKHPIYKESY
tara:strand:- start:62 stop:535 length:474 start_codon:yes stop_codon:yes gene_type:complete